jgi:hypothetical protein
MKFRVILLVSLLLNIGLLAAYFVTKKEPVTTVSEAQPNASAVRNRPEARMTRTMSVIETTNAFHWGTIESEDYRAYIENLRAVGCPEETIRDIIIADVNKLYGSRIAALYPTPLEFKFWRVEDQNARTEERERGRKRRELEEEKRNLIKELLGVDYETALARWSGRPDEDEYRYGFLSAEKQQAIKDLQAKYRDQERALFAEGGPRNPETRAKMLALRAQREAEMAQVLGPQDFQEYQLRNSNTARSMRENLASFQPSEEEFRKIFDARKAFDDQFGFLRDGGDEALREQRRTAQQQLDEQIRTTLGEERFKEYQLAQDDRYRDIYDFTSRNNLPVETAQTVYEARKAAEAARDSVLRNNQLTPEQRQAALANIAAETKGVLAGAMGDAFTQYAGRGDGRWLDTLARTENNRRGPPGEQRGGPPFGGDRGRFFRENRRP